MPRRRFWKKSVAKKAQAVLQTDVTEDTSLIKNSKIVDIDITEDTSLNKNSKIVDFTSDMTEDTGLVKNSEIADCEDNVLKILAKSQTNLPTPETIFDTKPAKKTEANCQTNSENVLLANASDLLLLEQTFNTTNLSDVNSAPIPFQMQPLVTSTHRFDQQSYISLNFGTVHQASERFPADSRGMQCTCNSLMSLVSLKSEQYLKSKLQDIDDILLTGDELFRIRMTELKSTDKFVSKMLQFNELPSNVSLSEKKYEIQYHDQIYGILTHPDWKVSYTPNLQEAIERLFQNYSQGLIIVGGICSAVYLDGNRNPSIFDSHSHGPNGLSCVDGRAMEMCFQNIDHLVNFMFSFYQSVNISMTTQFEIQPVTINNLTDTRIAFHLTKDNQNREGRKSLIDKYFDYQTKKARMKRLGESSLANRKKYMKEYMQKRRESSQFRDRENRCSVRSKQKSRANKENKQMERKSTLKCMKKARQSMEFLEHELEAKQKKREQLETKLKDRQSTLKSMKKARQSKEFLEHELEAKQKQREQLETKLKDRQSTLKSMKKARQSKEFLEHELEAKQKQREQLETKLKDRQSTLKSMKKARQSKEFLEHELEAKQKKREQLEKKLKDRQSTLKSMKKARQSKEFLEHELEAKQKKREQLEKKLKDRQSTLKSMKKARQSKEFLEHELEAKQKKREQLEKKLKDRQSTLKSMKKARQSKEFLEHELEAKQKKREQLETKLKNRESTLKSMRKARQSGEFQKHELEAKQKKRVQLETKPKERRSTLKSMNKARQSKEYCDLEINRKRLARKNPLQLEKERLEKQKYRIQFRQTERCRNKTSKATKRKDVRFLEHENALRKKRSMGSTMDECILKFRKKVAHGPIYVCTCCHQTWFCKSVVQLDKVQLSLQSKNMCTGLISVEGKEWLCSTCLVSLRENKIPKLSVKNGMSWPEKPEVLNLHPLEERLISQRIPFMQIRELPRGGQLSAKGNIVNVPVDIQPTINALPRQIDEHVTVAVKLKKRLSHKSSCFSENIRPKIVIKALHWLMKNSELYKNANIQIDQTWEERITNTDEEKITELTGTSYSKDDRDSEDVCDNFCEISSEEACQGNTDTLVDEADFDTNKIFVFAPGENQKPISLYEDKDAEYLCFPTIFCGQKRMDNEDREKKVYYSDIAKWELRSVDRRAAQSVPNIFFKLKKIQIKQVSDKVNLALRRCKSDGKKITAEQVRTESSANNIVRLNEGYYIFRTLRNSPAYLSSKKKDAFAMIRQLGIPTWFMSLSSADTKWLDLLKTLARLNGTILSDEEVASLDWNTKSNLVKKDPVTCARYFDNRVQEFINSVIKSDHNPIGKVTDVFTRVEFQNRGSPHIHMLLWTNDAPKYPDADEKSIIEYVDKYVTCSLQTDDPELKNLIDLQVHKHSKTCKKGGKSVCRFGFPLPPLPKTMLLEPLETDVEEYRRKYNDLQQKMNDYKDGCNLEFESFLHDIADMSLEDYIKCIRASLKGPKIFLKRRPSEMRVNYYNSAILKAWSANLDIQFVLDPYACATYIVSYISKSQRGISAMLEKASQEAAEGNMDLKHQVRHIGNKFLNFVEVGAQEACYLILQMPLTRASRDVVFINTSTAHERVFLLKTEDEINNLPDHSTDIHAKSMIERYSKRPKQLENWCLADYISQLEVTFPKEMVQSEQKKETNDDEEEAKCEEDDWKEDISENGTDSEIFTPEDVLVTLKNGIKIRKRKNYRVIRFVGFSRKTNSENYYREKILLYLPWRNEEKDTIVIFETYEEHYRRNARTIQDKQKMYEHFVEELEQARQQAEEDTFDYDDVAPNTEHAEAEDAEAGILPSEEFIHFDPDTVQHKEFDIGPEIGLGSKPTDLETSAVRMPDDEYRTLLQSLNSKQREFHNHVTKWLREEKEPLYAFLSGGAGTGKSVVIDAVYQTLHRLLCSEEGEDPDDVRILLCAYTGKAAYNINGTTIASAFHKKMYQTQQHMHADELNSFRTKYRNLSVVIIDEVSMVGNKLLTFINERLQQVTGKKMDFGGISVIAVGDLYQLQPVADSWIFKDLSNPGQGLATNLWKEHFEVFELAEIMRQKGDIQFTKLLNRLRHGELSTEDRQILLERKIEQGNENYSRSTPHLFIENKFVDSFNSNLIENLATNKVQVKSDTDILLQTKLNAEVKKRLIQALPDKQSTTGQLKSNLTIAVDMIYDISVNLDVNDGLTNGATCVVKHIEYKDSNIRPAIVWVLFDDQKVGTHRKNQYRHLYTSDIDTTWTPIFETKRTFMYNRKTYERVQFPLQPSAAKTVHKAQGATLTSVVISLNQTRTRKIPHIHYVALSRVKSLNQLYILDFNELSLAKDDAVDTEMERLRNHELKLCFTPLYAIEAETKCLFNNARSMHKHFTDIKSDPNVPAADIIGIAESRLCNRDPDDSVALSDYQIYRNDSHCSGIRPHHGLLIYVKNKLEVLKFLPFSSENVEFSILVVKSCSVILQFVVIYKKPSCPFLLYSTFLQKNLLSNIDPSEKIMIMGDFNIDLQKEQKHFLSFMEKTFNCKQVLDEQTTKLHTQIDHIYTNAFCVQNGVLEAYWSDHHMIYSAVNLH